MLYCGLIDPVWFAINDYKNDRDYICRTVNAWAYMLDLTVVIFLLALRQRAERSLFLLIISNIRLSKRGVYEYKTYHLLRMSNVWFLLDGRAHHVISSRLRAWWSSKPNSPRAHAWWFSWSQHSQGRYLTPTTPKNQTTRPSPSSFNFPTHRPFHYYAFACWFVDTSSLLVDSSACHLALNRLSTTHDARFGRD